jgi:hypothetical protein
MKYVIDKQTGDLIEKQKEPALILEEFPVPDWWVEYMLLMEEVGAIFRGEVSPR